MSTLEEQLAQVGLRRYARSTIKESGTTYFLARDEETNEKWLGVRGDTSGFSGEREGDLLLCPLTAENAATLRARLPWLNPVTLGLTTSVGTGDRLGLATPGHIRAVRAHNAGAATDVAPILAQQSMRENARTGRTPQEVVDDAVWGIVQEGWRKPWGADADHLKSTADVDLCVAAGYTFFTVDPGAHVDNAAHEDSVDILREKFAALPWEGLEDSPAAMRARYLDETRTIGDDTYAYDEKSLLRAACKYGRALAHTARMYRHLAAAMGDTPFELEVSVDETETPTSPLEHLFIASELQRLGVQWVSLAPRYVGRFEKGVDYIGDLDIFEREFARHAAIAREFGPYKLSVHSGSDKFSIYEIMARHTQGLMHLKTAGTSYLEALRTIAEVDPEFFREILALARERYPQDRATYHVSASVDNVPPPEALSDDELAGVLDIFDGREVLHVTFGSVLDAYGERLLDTLAAHEEAHYDALEKHFIRHLENM